MELMGMNATRRDTKVEAKNIDLDRTVMSLKHFDLNLVM